MAVFELLITNTTPGKLAFYLEPWGGKYAVPSQGALRVVIEAPTPPRLEWEFAEDAHTLIVHGPAGAVATVYEGQKRVSAE
jgi:hypothetical protein